MWRIIAKRTRRVSAISQRRRLFVARANASYGRGCNHFDFKRVVHFLFINCKDLNHSPFIIVVLGDNIKNNGRIYEHRFGYSFSQLSAVQRLHVKCTQRCIIHCKILNVSIKTAMVTEADKLTQRVHTRQRVRLTKLHISRRGETKRLTVCKRVYAEKYGFRRTIYLTASK